MRRAKYWHLLDRVKHNFCCFFGGVLELREALSLLSNICRHHSAGSGKTVRRQPASESATESRVKCWLPMRAHVVPHFRETASRTTSFKDNISLLYTERCTTVYYTAKRLLLSFGMLLNRCIPDFPKQPQIHCKGRKFVLKVSLSDNVPTGARISFAWNARALCPYERSLLSKLAESICAHR